MHRDSQAWLALYRGLNASFVHNGTARQPHALLTNGKHTGAYFNSEIVMRDPRLLTQACEDMLELLEGRGFDINEPDWVVGPVMGGVAIALELARLISNRRRRVCYWAYAEKDGEGPDKRFVFKRADFAPGVRLLVCEDVINTGGSVKRLVANATDKNARVLSHLPHLVNRLGKVRIANMDAVPLLEQITQEWEPNACPLCKLGSQAMAPKIGNWHCFVQ